MHIHSGSTRATASGYRKYIDDFTFINAINGMFTCHKSFKKLKYRLSDIHTSKMKIPTFLTSSRPVRHLLCGDTMDSKTCTGNCKYLSISVFQKNIHCSRLTPEHKSSLVSKTLRGIAKNVGIQKFCQQNSE